MDAAARSPTLANPSGVAEVTLDWLGRMGRSESELSLASLAHSVASGGTISRVPSIAGSLSGSVGGGRIYSRRASPAASPVVGSMRFSPSSRSFHGSPSAGSLHLQGTLEEFELPATSALTLKVSLSGAPRLLPSSASQWSDVSDGTPSPLFARGAAPPPLEEEDRAIPIRVIALLCMAQVAHFYSMCSIFSYAGFLCVDSGWVASQDKVPRHSPERL